MSTTDTDALTERIAAALTEHWRAKHTATGTPCSGCTAAVLPIVAVEVRKAKAEALRAWASGVESQLDATTSEGIDLGEWGRGLRSGVQQARDTADRIEAGDSDERG